MRRKALTRGSEGGRWKSARSGNSLAAYPTKHTGIQDQHPEWVEVERRPQVVYRRVPDLDSLTTLDLCRQPLNTAMNDWKNQQA